jgi:hypothetical protein
MVPLALVPLVAHVLLGVAPTFVEVRARFEPPARRGGEGAILVTLTPLQPAIVVNDAPEPRLTLDPQQQVLIDRQVPNAGGAPADAERAKALDPKVPVRFPVALAAEASPGVHQVKATVVFFFCSKAEGWCRKGKAEIEVVVTVE